MADRTISDLPSVTNVEDSIALPVEQSGTARKMTIGDISSHIGSSGSGGAYVVTFDEYGGATTASANASTIFTQVTNNKSVELKVKTGANEYSVGKLLYVSKSGSAYSAFFEVKHGADVVKKYVIDQNSNCVMQQQYNVAITSGQTTYADPNHLTLNYVPSAGTDAVNKDYVDSLSDSGAVSSVNGKVGTVILKTSDIENDSNYITFVDVPVKSVNGKTGVVAVAELPDVDSFDNGKVLGVINGRWAALVPSDLPTEEVPDPTGPLEDQLSLCDSDPFTAQIYNGVIKGNWWDEQTDGDIDHFYAYLCSAARANNLTFPTDNGKIAMVSGGVWRAVVPQFVTEVQAARAAPVQSVNGKTGTVVLRTSDIQNNSNYVTATQAANAAPVQSVNGKTGAVIVSEMPDSTNANTGDTLMKTENGIEWGSVFPASNMYDAGKFLAKDVYGNNIWKYCSSSIGVSFDSMFADDSGMTLITTYPGYDNAHSIAGAAGSYTFGAITFTDVNTQKVYYLDSYYANSNNPTQSYVSFQRFNKDTMSFEYATITGNSSAYTSVSLSSVSIGSN